VVPATTPPPKGTGSPSHPGGYKHRGRHPFLRHPLGSQNKSLDLMTAAPITNLRAGRHSCFDRLVVDLHAKGANYSVRYLRVVLNQGEGAPIPLRGSARLENVVKALINDVNTGAQTFHFANRKELSNVKGFAPLRQVSFGGSFEGYTTIGLGSGRVCRCVPSSSTAQAVGAALSSTSRTTGDPTIRRYAALAS
jgi:hypothetical protein